MFTPLEFYLFQNRVGKLIKDLIYHGKYKMQYKILTGFKYVFSISILIFFIQSIYADVEKDYAADLISIQGFVEILPVPGKDWIPARDFQKLYPGDIIRTGDLSRAAILFIDHTQIKLNEKTVLEIKDIKMGNETSVSWGRTAKSLFNLVTGEIWVHSGGEALDLEVDTPIASATVRGTEFVIRSDKEKTTVTVVDGAVNLANSYGEVLISSGEQGIASSDKPPYKTIIINPQDAVQWALYYPGNISNEDYKDIPSDEMTVIEKFFDLYRQKKLKEAINLASGSFPESPRILTLLGFGELMAGNVTGAKENISKALSIDPLHSLAHSILSNIYLVQNDKEKAREEAETAIRTNLYSPSAYVSLSWVRQSYFDLYGAIEACRKAVELDPRNIQAHVTLCRLLFGSDKIKEAEDIINKAVKIAPDESAVNASFGFLLLASGKTHEAIDYFTKSIAQDSTQGLGHLGLGLANIRLKDIPEGLREMLIATLLEPKVSLYQSYMGKAYYQVAKEYARWGVKKEEAVNYKKYLGLAEKTLLNAVQLDPKDPTPYLYCGILLNDINKPVDAIEKFNKSIELNSNRAVYRSRLLLDRDLATENVSLAQVYNRLGLSSWGGFLAMRSLQSDFSISGAHRFLGSSYLALKRGRTQAGGSELLQARLFSPVNENSFNTFNTYTSLFEVPDFNARFVMSAGEDEVSEYAAAINGGTGHYAFAQVVSYNKDSGYLEENDDYSSWSTITMLKYSTAPRSHLYSSFASYLSNEGDHAPSWDPFQNDLDGRLIGELYEGALGYYSQLNHDTHIIIYTKTKNNEFRFKDELMSLLGSTLMPSEDKTEDAFKFWDGQIELVRRFSDHQFVLGFGHYNGTVSHDEELKVTPFVFESPRIKLPQRFTTLIVRDYWRLNDTIEFDLGFRYNKATDGKTDFSDTVGTSKLTPQAGFLVKPFEKTTLRFAGINSIQKPLEENIFPTNTSGFIIDRNEETSAESTEYTAALDQIVDDKTFFTISGSYRDRDTPTPIDFTYEDKFTGGNCVLNRILNKCSALSLEYNFLRSDDTIGLRNDHQVKMHLGFVHHTGWFGELTEAYVYQKNTELIVAEPFNTSFWTTNAVIGYEFPKKHGKLSLSIENLFDNDFKVVTDPLVVDNRLPVRRAILKAEIYF